MGICTQTNCKHAVEMFKQDTCFFGDIAAWSADDMSLTLKGEFDLKEMFERLEGANFEALGGVQHFSLMDRYLAQSVEIKIDGEYERFEFEESSEYSDSNGLDVHTSHQAELLRRAKAIIDDCWNTLKKSWEAVRDGEYEIFTADSTVPEAQIQQYPDFEFTLAVIHSQSDDGYIPVNDELSKCEVYLDEVATGETIAAHYQLTVEVEGEEFTHDTDGVVGCKKADRDGFVMELFMPCIDDALAHQNMSNAA